MVQNEEWCRANAKADCLECGGMGIVSYPSLQSLEQRAPCPECFPLDPEAQAARRRYRDESAAASRARRREAARARAR
jgi:hypothetical protein